MAERSLMSVNSCVVTTSGSAKVASGAVMNSEMKIILIIRALLKLNVASSSCGCPGLMFRCVPSHQGVKIDGHQIINDQIRLYMQ
jgi:hypothetical protein